MLCRGDQPLTCPMSTRIPMPVAPKGGLQINPKQMDFAIQQGACSSGCALFGFTHYEVSGYKFTCGLANLPVSMGPDGMGNFTEL